MITLTTPIAIKTTLGSSATINYDRLDVININYDVTNKNISGTCVLISSANASAQQFSGTFTIQTSGSPVITVNLPNLPFNFTQALTGAQVTTVQGWVTSTQNTVESGLISVGVAAGAQSAGL